MNPIISITSIVFFYRETTIAVVDLNDTLTVKQQVHRSSDRPSSNMTILQWNQTVMLENLFAISVSCFCLMMSHFVSFSSTFVTVSTYLVRSETRETHDYHFLYVNENTHK